MTKDDVPVIFHDNFIFSEDNVRISPHLCLFFFFLLFWFNLIHVVVGNFNFQAVVYEKRVTELLLSDFLRYGPQREPGKVVVVVVVV